MPAEPMSPQSIRFNLNLVVAEAKRWPWATAIVLAIIAALTIAQLSQDPRYHTFDIVIGVAGYLVGMVGLKTLWLLMAYPVVNRSRFPGSYLVATYIAMIPVFTFYAIGVHILAIETGETPPLLVMIPFGFFAYMLFTIFWSAFARAMEWMHRDKFNAPRDKE